MADDSYDDDYDEPAPKKRDNLFVWTVFILLLIGLAFACWLGSFMSSVTRNRRGIFGFCSG